ncbi:MAG: hypothetical protein AAFM92_10140 [Pseudomonadota bacterium]
MQVKIPKILGHIWVGTRAAPTELLDSWREFHPDWEYRLYDNDYLFSRTWRNQALIAEYYRVGRYSGVSDLMRYEILHEMGGFIPEADSRCLRATDDLWDMPHLYAVYENEEEVPGFISPFLASVPGHPYLDDVIAHIGRRWTPDTIRAPWKCVGNAFLARRLQRHPAEDYTVFPSHYFIPTFRTGTKYKGDGPVYCEQLYGSTKSRLQIYPPRPENHEELAQEGFEYLTGQRAYRGARAA